MNDLRHFSILPVFSVRSVRQENPADAMLCHTKPRGLWVSDEADENSWSRWCSSESFGLAPIEHHVRLAADANVLCITSVSDLDSFSQDYGKCSNHQHFRDEPAIQWGDVAKDYDGILISPYQGEWRLHPGSSWYYGWDCASGCIWRDRAVANIEPIGMPRQMAEALEKWLDENSEARP